MTGRSGHEARNLSSTAGSAHRAAAPNLRSSTPSIRAPSPASRSASRSSRARMRSKAPNTARAEAGTRPQRRTLDSDNRAESNASRAPPAFAANSRFGHNSLSTSTPRSGRQWPMKASTASGVSIGAYWWMAPGGSRRAISSAAARVPVVTRIETSGCVACARSAKESSAMLSPRLAPCSQRSLPPGRRAEARPHRSASRAGSSRPARARRDSHSLNAGVAARAATP